MSRRIALLAALLLLVMGALACNLPVSATVTPEAQTATAGALLVKAGSPTVPQQGATLPTSTFTAVATNTPVPSATQPASTATNVPTATNTPIPCNLATFVADVNYADGSQLQTGTGFTKTWRLKNIGSCTWTSSYQMVFASGDAMNAAAAVQLTAGTVPPNGTVDVSIAMTAPASAGTYKAFFKLKAPDGTLFGIGSSGQDAFWVQIVSVAPTSTPTNPPPAAVPDLIISDITFVPNPPTSGVAFTVKVTVYNQGTGPASQFTVRWKSTKTAPDDNGCKWDFMESLVAKGGRLLECTYTYASWYATNTTVASADISNHVSESNEGNNTYEKEFSVNK